MSDTQNLKSGICPKCGGNEVYTNNGILKRGERTKLALGFSTTFTLDTYKCTSCGYFEEHITDKHLNDPTMMAGLKKELKKV